MSQLNVRLKPRKSSTSGEVPQPQDLEVAEIAINTADGRIFTKHTDNSIKEIINVSGAGLVRLEDDENPTLGGDLNTNGFSIVTLAGQDITLAPNTTGDVVIRGRNSFGSAGIQFNTDTNTEYVRLAVPTTAELSGSYTLVLPDSPGLPGQTVISDGTGKLSWAGVVGNSLEGLTDVNLDTPPSGGDVLMYNQSEGYWNATALSYETLPGAPDPADFATAAQGAKADSAVQPGDLATVATSGSYNDLSDTPTLGTSSIDDLGDVDTTTVAPATGEALTWNGTNWVPGVSGEVEEAPLDGQQYARQYGGWTVVEATSGGGGVAGMRVEETQSVDATDISFTKLGSSGKLALAEATVDCWVTIYIDDASRTADASRSVDTDPALGSGVLADFTLTAGSELVMTPFYSYWNNDDPAASVIYARVRSAAGAAVTGILTLHAYPDNATRVSEVVTTSTGLGTAESIGSAGQLISIESDTADTWVTLYSSEAARVADAGRSFNEDPASGSGVLGEFLLAADTPVLATPIVTYFNSEEPGGTSIYLATRTSAGVASDVNITIDAYNTRAGGSSSGGGGTSDVDALDDLSDVDVAPEPYYNNFSGRPPFPVVQSPTEAGLSSDHFLSGTQSFKMTTQYGGGWQIGSPFTNEAAKYDVISLNLYSSQELNTTYRQTLMGNKGTVQAGAGYTIYTRDTGFAFFGNGGFTEFGTRPTIPANQWNHFLVQLEWANGRRQPATGMSIWVNGELACDNADVSVVNYSAPDYSEKAQLHSLVMAYSSGVAYDRWMDDIRAAQFDTPFIPLGTATIDPVAVQANLALVPRQLPDGAALSWNSYTNTWEASELVTSDTELNDLRDVSYIGGSLEIEALDEIKFTSSDALTDAENAKIFANATSGLGMGHYTDLSGAGSYVFVHRTKGTILRGGTDSGNVTWLSANTDASYQELRFSDHSVLSSTGNYVGLKTPSGLTSSQTFALPPADGAAGDVLVTDGSGNTSFSGDYISLTDLKAEVAASTDFADFQSRIAAL